MLLGCLYLLIEGAGRWSIDAILSDHNLALSPRVLTTGEVRRETP
jgi:hypothetical protein